MTKIVMCYIKFLCKCNLFFPVNLLSKYKILFHAAHFEVDGLLITLLTLFRATLKEKMESFWPKKLSHWRN